MQYGSYWHIVLNIRTAGATLTREINQQLYKHGWSCEKDNSQ